MENIWYPLTGKMEKQLRKKYLSDAIIYFLFFFWSFLLQWPIVKGGIYIK